MISDYFTDVEHQNPISRGGDGKFNYSQWGPIKGRITEKFTSTYQDGGRLTKYTATGDFSPSSPIVMGSNVRLNGRTYRIVEINRVMVKQAVHHLSVMLERIDTNE